MTKKKEIRIRVVAIQRTENVLTVARHVIQDGEETTFLGTGWRIEHCGALSILSEGRDGTETVDYTFGPGRWLEVFRDEE